MGPLTSAQHRDRVLGYVDVAREQGGEVLAGGKRARRGELARGCYVEPTVVRAQAVARPRRAGRGLRPLRHRADLQGRRRGAARSPTAPTTASAAACGPRNLQRAHRFARELHAGMVWINCYKRVNPGSPFGGVGPERLRPRDGLRRDARVHAGQERVGQRRRADPAVVSALMRTPCALRSAAQPSRASCSAPARCSSCRPRSSAWARSARWCCRRPSSARSAERVAALLGARARRRLRAAR